MRRLRVDPGWFAAAGGLAFLAGAAAQLQQRSLWPASTYLALCGAAALALLAAVWPARRAAPGIVVLALAALAFGGTGWRAQERLADRLTPALEGVDLLVDGVIGAMPQVSAEGMRFQFEVSAATRMDGFVVHVPQRLALSWYRGWADEALLAGPQVDLRAGQRWRLPLRLRRPHGAANPHGFDSELWMFERALGASGYVRAVAGGEPPRLLVDDAGHPIERLRQRIRDAVVLRIGDARVGGVLAALAVGDQAAIERGDWDLFRQTGVAHLMSISGLHVTMFAWLAALAIGWLWRRSTRLCLWLPAPLAARMLGVGVAAAYALVAGWGVPAQRTLLMLACAVGLRILGVVWPWPLVLLGAAVVVTAIDPWALLQAGFWLSFVAVGLLLASEPASGPGEVPHGLRTRLLSLLRAQAVATLGLAPLAMVFFQQVSVVGFVANLLAIPWVTLVVTPLALLGALVPALWAAAGAAVAALVWVLQLLAAVPWAVWTAAAAPAWAVAAGLLAAVIGLLPLPWRVRWLALPLALPLLAPPVERPGAGSFELVAVDIGQGTAVLVRTRTHLLIYDAGPAYAREGDAGQRIVAPLLRARGEQQVDRLMLSHRDSDHVGGAASLQAALPVREWHSSLEDSHPLRALAREHLRCDEGQTWQWDGVRFEVLHPRVDDYGRERRPNALSCVLRIQAADGASALLTGDIEAAQEAALVERLGARLASGVLLVPHHGSRTSSTDAFIDAVRPGVAVVQAGYRSRFGHPAAEVLARYEARSIELVRSDRCGAWIWREGRSSCTRDVQRRYWHWESNPAGADVAKASQSGD